MSDAVLAVPGDIATPTGGYGYARRLLAEAGRAGWALRHLALPGGFPFPDEAALAESARLLAAVPAGVPLIVDGLAFGALPAEVLRPVRAPLVALCHHPLAGETGLSPEAAAGLGASERAAFAHARAVVASSAATARELERDYGVAGARVARPGTDPAPPAAGSGGPGALILSVGALVPRKGHARLIGALARLTDLDWRCRIVGPADRDGAEAGRIQRLIADLGLGARVSLDGALGEEALGEAYHRTDVFALASAHEGFGMVFAEAVARALPTLGPDLAAVAEATAGGAWLVPADDAEGYAAALRRLIAEPEARAAWSR
ncbi:MAG TPA: glycosyltransferase, partial [Thermohalobaculum sp.]|nr:glycosyltransferase [Thermohalobaculum sp.]